MPFDWESVSVVGKVVPVLPVLPTVKTLFLNLIFSPCVTDIPGIQFLKKAFDVGVLGLSTILIACSIKSLGFNVLDKIPDNIPPIPLPIPLYCLRISWLITCFISANIDLLDAGILAMVDASSAFNFLLVNSFILLKMVFIYFALIDAVSFIMASKFMGGFIDASA